MGNITVTEKEHDSIEIDLLDESDGSVSSSGENKLYASTGIYDWNNEDNEYNEINKKLSENNEDNEINKKLSENKYVIINDVTSIYESGSDRENIKDIDEIEFELIDMTKIKATDIIKEKDMTNEIIEVIEVDNIIEIEEIDNQEHILKVFDKIKCFSDDKIKSIEDSINGFSSTSSHKENRMNEIELVDNNDTINLNNNSYNSYTRYVIGLGFFVVLSASSYIVLKNTQDCFNILKE